MFCFFFNNGVHIRGTLYGIRAVAGHRTLSHGVHHGLKTLKTYME